MSDPIRLRHTVTGKVVEKSQAEYLAMALTPLGKVYDVVDDEGGCIDCGPSTEEFEAVSSGTEETVFVDYDDSFYDDEEEVK